MVRRNVSQKEFKLTPLKSENITKKKGKTLEMTVKDGANAVIHWPQLAWKRKKSIVIKKT
jgi:hypothetical protein